MKLGLIRCRQTEDMCSTSKCLKAMRAKKVAFEGVEEEIELVGVNTCGGCPGKKTVTRVDNMVKAGADTIALASCITRGTPIDFACPHRDAIQKAICDRFASHIKIIDHTH